MQKRLYVLQQEITCEKTKFIVARDLLQLNLIVKNP